MRGVRRSKEPIINPKTCCHPIATPYQNPAPPSSPLGSWPMQLRTHMPKEGGIHVNRGAHSEPESWTVTGLCSVTGTEALYAPIKCENTCTSISRTTNMIL
jgi:hypothetical protein